MELALYRRIAQDLTGSFAVVDLLCVNQTDLLKRESQVCLMDKIFSTAPQVVVWLGEATDKSSKGTEPFTIP